MSKIPGVLELRESSKELEVEREMREVPSIARRIEGILAGARDTSEVRETTIALDVAREIVVVTAAE
jgi:hypothetical protein